MDVNGSFDSIVKHQQQVQQAISAKVLGTPIQGQNNNLALLTEPVGEVICERLYRLQYLSGEQWQAYQLALTQYRAASIQPLQQWQSEFASALVSLQREAGLKVDRWFGAKTFQVIQQVFTFEEPTHIAFWFKHQNRDFINRAIFQRLYAMAVLPGEMPRLFDNAAPEFAHQQLEQYIKQGLQLWSAVLRAFDVPATTLSSDYELVNWLFDVEGLTRHLSAHRLQLKNRFDRVYLDPHWETLPLQALPDLNDTQRQSLALRVMLAQSRVELWLQGYALGKSADEGVFMPGDTIRYHFYSPAFTPMGGFGTQLIGPGLRRQMAFWRDSHHLFSAISADDLPPGLRLDRKVVTPLRIAKDIKQKHLTLASMALHTIHCAAVLGALPQPDELEQQNRLQEEYLKLKPEHKTTQVWQQDRHFFATVLDGVKRLSRWLWDKVKSIFQAVTEAVQRVVRMVQAIASKGLAYFNRVIDIFCATAWWVTQKIWVNEETLVVVRDSDFDIGFLAAPDCTEATLQQATDKIQHKVTMFRAGCILLSLLMEVFKLVLAGVGGIAKWKIVDAVWAIANFYRALSEEDIAYLDSAMAMELV